MLINPFLNLVCKAESGRKTKWCLYYQNWEIIVDVDLEVKQSQTGWRVEKDGGQAISPVFQVLLCLGTVEIVENLAYLQI